MMTALFSRLRPSSLHAGRRRRRAADHAELKPRTALQASDERLATRFEIEIVGARQLTGVTGS